jgi:hypothetical protein
MQPEGSHKGHDSLLQLLDRRVRHGSILQPFWFDDATNALP